MSKGRLSKVSLKIWQRCKSGTGAQGHMQQGIFQDGRLHASARGALASTREENCHSREGNTYHILEVECVEGGCGGAGHGKLLCADEWVAHTRAHTVSIALLLVSISKGPSQQVVGNAPKHHIHHVLDAHRLGALGAHRAGSELQAGHRNHVRKESKHEGCSGCLLATHS